MNQHSEKLGNLEFRTCNANLLDNGDYTTGEIIQYGDKFCWTIAYWESGESFDLHFVGSRPFAKEVDSKDFWVLAGFGQEFLEASKSG